MSVLQAVGVCDLRTTRVLGAVRRSTHCAAQLVARGRALVGGASPAAGSGKSSPCVRSLCVESALNLSSISGTHKSRISAQAGPLLARAARACEIENGTPLSMQMQCIREAHSSESGAQAGFRASFIMLPGSLGAPLVIAVYPQ